jgi:hypothetical protein
VGEGVGTEGEGEGAEGEGEGTEGEGEGAEGEGEGTEGEGEGSCVPSDDEDLTCDDQDDDCDGETDEDCPPRLVFEDEELDFGDVRVALDHVTRRTRVVNQGVLPATGLILALSGEASGFEILLDEVESCPWQATLGKGQGCLVKVRFTTDSPGQRQAMLEASAANAPTAWSALRATGIAYTSFGELAEAYPYAGYSLGDRDGGYRGHALASDGEVFWIAGAAPSGAAAAFDTAVWKVWVDEDGEGHRASGFPLALDALDLDRTDEARGIALVEDGAWVAGFHTAAQWDQQISLWHVALQGENAPAEATWHEAIDLPEGSEQAADLVVDDGGGVWLTGSFLPAGAAAGDTFLFLVRWDPTASAVTQQVVRTAAVAGTFESGAALALDRTRNLLWIAGSQRFAPDGQPAQHQLALWQYDLQGRPTNGYPRLSPGCPGCKASATDLVLDEAGNVWVAGWVSDAAAGDRCAFWKFTDAGALADGFPRVMDNVTADRDWQGCQAQAIALAPDGYLWATGWARTAAEDEDLVLWKLDDQGEPRHGLPRTFDDREDGRGADWGLDLLVDAAGRVWVSGFSASGGGSDNDEVTLWKFE